MPLPFVNPVELAMTNLRSFQGIRQSLSATKINEAKLAKIESEKKEGLETQKDLGILFENPNPSAEDITTFLGKHPTVSKHFKQTFDVMSAEKKRNTQKEIMSSLNLLATGRTDLVIQAFETRVEAAENSGLDKEAAAAKSFLEILNTNPDTAKNSLLMTLAATQGPAEFKKAYDETQALGKPVRDPAVIKAEEAYAKVVGTKAAERDSSLHDLAINSVDNLTKLDEVIVNLETSDAITGMGAELLKGYERFKVFVSDSKEAGKKVTDTEYLNAALGSDVFPMIKALGIGARGLDTPAEREFLREVMTGTISMNKATLIRLTKARRNISKKIIDKYNKRVDSGELDKFFQHSTIGKKRIEVSQVAPVAPTTPTPPPVPVAPVAPSADLSTMSPEAIAAEIAQLQAGQ